MIHRYDHVDHIQTPLDPLQDVISWVKGLRSEGYVKKVLKKKGDTEYRDIEKSAQLISNHCDVSVSFIKQAFEGKDELSFLPLYYAILNISKATIISEGKRVKLKKHKQHGVSWSGIGKRSKNMLTDEITVYENGVFPLLYESVTGDLWPKTKMKNKNDKWISNRKRKIKMGSIYPYILPISHEYQMLKKEPKFKFTGIKLTLESHPEDEKSRLEINVDKNTVDKVGKRSLRILSGLRKVEDGLYVTKYVDAEDKNMALNKFDNVVRRFLIYGYYDKDKRKVRTITPICSSNLLLPEEVPIFISFFHLSNIVRYDPSRLLRTFNSEFAGMLQTLSRQGIFRYMVLFWSKLHNTSTYIR